MTPPQLIIFSATITERLKYSIDFVFGECFEVNYILTKNAAEFEQSTLPKIEYSDKKSGGIQIVPHGLLFEHRIEPQKISVVPSTTPYFFATGGTLPFDIFSAIFYLISRYEEYLPFTPDEHGRFSALNSLAFRHDFLQIPIIDKWLEEFKEVLIRHYPQIKFKTKKYNYTPTFDIDNAYAYLNKGFCRSLGSYGKALLKGNFGEVRRRNQTFFGHRPDPYYTYGYIKQSCRTYSVTPIFFWLLGDYARYDKNVHWENKKFQQLIREIAKEYPVGIHPSYASNASPERLKMEKERLETITGKQIIKSRQHYIKLSFPTTYQGLLKVGIKEDYSMGYADEIGFRAGTCMPFYFFDLEKNETTGLKIYPFAIMEGVLKDRFSYSIPEAVEAFNSIGQEIESVKGNFISIWHNESLSNEKRWEGWREVYEKTVISW